MPQNPQAIVAIENDGTIHRPVSRITIVGAATVTDLGSGNIQIDVTGGDGGNVTGPTPPVVDGHLVVWDGTDAEHVKDGGAVPSHQWNAGVVNTLGTNLSITGTTLNASAGGSNPLLSSPITFTGDPTGLAVSFGISGVQAGGAYVGGLLMTDSTTAANGLLTIDYGQVDALASSFVPSMTALTSLSFPSLKSGSSSFSPTVTALLTLNMPSLIHSITGFEAWLNTQTALTHLILTDWTGSVGDFTPSLRNLMTVDLSAFATCGGSFGPVLGDIVSLDLPVLTSTTNGFFPNFGNDITGMSVPLLATCGGNFEPGGLTAGSAPLLTTLDLSALTTVAGNLSIGNLSALANVNLSGVTTIGSFHISTGDAGTLPVITSLSLPALTTCGADILVESAPSLTNFSLGAIQTIGDDGTNSIKFDLDTGALITFSLGSDLKQMTKDIVMTSCSLNVASVNALLVALAALDGTRGTTLYTGNTVMITGTSATPTGAGLTAKAALIAPPHSCTVTTN